MISRLFNLSKYVTLSTKKWTEWDNGMEGEYATCSINWSTGFWDIDSKK